MENLGHVLGCEIGCMYRVDTDCKLEGWDESGSGEVESDHEPIETILNEGLSSSDAGELAIDINLEEAITDSTASSKNASWQEAHG